MEGTLERRLTSMRLSPELIENLKIRAIHERRHPWQIVDEAIRGYLATPLKRKERRSTRATANQG